MRVEWDPDKARENRRKHGVDFADAAIALEDENALSIEDRDHDEVRFKMLGMRPQLKVLLVVHIIRTGGRIRIISARRRRELRLSNTPRESNMTDDFSKGRRGAVVRPDSGKVRITIRLDPEIIEHFKGIVLDSGGGNYQTLINDVLLEHVRGSGQSLEKKLRRIIREELKKAS